MTSEHRARYRLAREQGTIIKDWGGRIPIALVYPNSYRVGMSSLGLQAIYSLLNGYDDVVCERIFCEGDRSALKSVESQRPIGDFACLAFSVSYELDYYNVVDALKSSGIPPLSADRDRRHPLVVAGGPCLIANPEPLAPVCDGLAVGEGEVIVPPMVEAIAEGIGGGREGLLDALGAVPGLYCPARGEGAARAWVQDLDRWATASAITTPDTELGDMYLVEVGRGCRWGCRFCLAGFSFRPPRFRSTGHIVDLAQRGIAQGKRIGLVGPSVSDHPDTDGLVAALRGRGARLSVSSLRVCPLPPSLLEALAASGTETVTLAPEAGSERLRRAINKGVTDADIIAAMEAVAAHGFKHVKLYFMVGLPTEDDEDIDALIALVTAIKGRLDRGRAGCRLALTVAPFVPKATTPFQWLPMADAAVLTRRTAAIERALKPRGIEVRTESVHWSQVQAVLARGDRSLAAVLAHMERASLSAWRRALDECAVDAARFIGRQIPPDEALPWAHLDSGVDLAYLKDERERAGRGEETPPCPTEECHQCGVC